MALRFNLEELKEHNYPLWMYGIETDSNYFSERDRNFKFRLHDGESPKLFVIKVKLIGERVEDEYVFHLRYDGKANDMKISRVMSLSTTIGIGNTTKLDT